MTFGRDLARLLRNPDTSGWGDLLGIINVGTSVVGGLALGIATGRIGVGVAAVPLLFGALFVMLANRTTIILAGVASALTLGGSFGFLGFLLFGPIGAVLAGGGAAAAIGLIYRSIVEAQQVQQEDPDWY